MAATSLGTVVDIGSIDVGCVDGVEESGCVSGCASISPWTHGSGRGSACAAAVVVTSAVPMVIAASSDDAVMRAVLQIGHRSEVVWRSGESGRRDGEHRQSRGETRSTTEANPVEKRNNTTGDAC
ncbi:hypothetical protein [Nocardia nova]|uniref:hypothetical protein n=1 Tax=Nocardia nova TaxID=37330 RepID=UPI0027387D7C|nr:hypothetical protein [Nocardia nova]